MVQLCPSCGRLYRKGSRTCPRDGVALQTPTDPRTGVRVGNYLFMGRLGRGGMGSVYRGAHVVIGKEVAIKVLHKSLAGQQQAVQRFLMEARAASMIRHPNIIDITDFGRLDDGCSFFVMEFLDGPTLHDVLDLGGGLPLYRTVNILTQVCRALHACHSKRIAHRDLKPENIVLLQREGQRDLVHLPPDPTANPVVQPERTWDFVKILDFGIARIQEVTASLDRASAERGFIVGSPYYLAPEQARGQPGDHRTDIYALGVIFYEMLTGDVPFGGETAREIIEQHLSAPPPRLSERHPDLTWPEEVELLARRAMAKRPEQRYQSAAAFLKDLSECFGDVIYGRDIGRYLTVQRRKTGEHPAIQPHSPPSTGAATLAGNIHTELQDLFQDKYEQARPVTESTLQAIKRSRQPAPDVSIKEELEELFDKKEELAGLFPREDEE